ncbi:MAG: bifunctional nuclease family protein [Halolamina sp.]
MANEAAVEGIAVGVASGGERVPAVLLRARGEYLPIFVTEDQAESIQLALDDEPFDRPLTHDLMLRLLREFGGAVDGVRIDDLSDGTFYAKIDAQRYDDGEPEPFVFDARPSDAIALAVRADCAVTVSDEVLNLAGRPPEDVDLEGS